MSTITTSKRLLLVLLVFPWPLNGQQATMTGKTALINVIHDASLSKQDMCTAALRCARQNHMGTAKIERILTELYGSLDAYWILDGTVEGAINVLVESAITEHRNRDGTTVELEEPTAATCEGERDHTINCCNELCGTQPEKGSNNALVDLVEQQDRQGNLDSDNTENCPSQLDQRELSTSPRAATDAILSMCKDDPEPSYASNTSSDETGRSTSCAYTQTEALSAARESTTSDLRDLFLEMKLLRNLVEAEQAVAKDREARASRQASIAEKKIGKELDALREENERLTKTVDHLNKKVASLQSTLDKVHSSVRNFARTALPEMHESEEPRMNQTVRQTDSFSRVLQKHQPLPDISQPTPHQQHSDSVSQRTRQVSSPTKHADANFSIESSAFTLETVAGNVRDSASTSSSRERISGLHTQPVPVLEPKPPGQWHVVQKKKAVAKPQEKRNPLGKLVGAQRVKKQVFYLGGISIECFSDDIVSFCKDRCPILECRIMPSKRSGTQAARIVVQEKDGQTLEMLEWPEHVYLRRWNFDTLWGSHGESQ